MWITIGLVAVAAVPALAADGGAKTPIVPEADGTITLPADRATLHGEKIVLRPWGDTGDICTWVRPDDWVSWEFSLPQPGSYLVEFLYSCDNGVEGSTFEVAVGESRLAGKISRATGSWEEYRRLKVGTLDLKATAEQTLSIRPRDIPHGAVMNLRRVRLVPAEKYEAKIKAELLAPLQALHRTVMVVPNFHPASCGWLTDFSTERNYCGYTYLSHLDRVRDDPTYCFALSEVNTQMAILAFEPERFEELKRRIREGRVEACNAFFLEPTITLSGGEALVKCGVEGLRWQEQILGVRPRLAWMIDICGVHEQMGQIVAGLGLDAMVYCRNNPTHSVPHWLQSPDGTRALAINSSNYADLWKVFSTPKPLNLEQLSEWAVDFQEKSKWTPPGAPIFILGGYGDYSRPPRYQNYPREFLKQWEAVAPHAPLSFTVPSRYLDALLPLIQSGKVKLPVTQNGTWMNQYNSFWNENPKAKTSFRRSEHRLQAAEALSAVASLQSPFRYPTAPLYHAWLLLCLNMDRNSLWGAAGGMVFEHPTSWDVRDRYEKVQEITAKNTEQAFRGLLDAGDCVGLFNPMNFPRSTPFLVELPQGTRLRGVTCQADADGLTLCRVDLPPFSTSIFPRIAEPAPSPQPAPLPETIETKHYSAKINPASGALASLKLKPSGREILEKPVLVVAERGADFHDTLPRPRRKRLADSAQFKPEIEVAEGPLATVVRARGKFFGGGELCQTIRFYADDPRIDFEVETENIPDDTLVLVEFPFAREIKETRRGVPYGFAHCAWATPNPELSPFGDGVLPAVRWSHYAFTGGGGAAILDRGCTGRELNGKTPVLFLMNAHDIYMGYRCPWLSGKPRQKFEFALYPHDGEWNEARVPQRAWEYNAPPLIAWNVKQAAPKSYLRTSENVIVEALRREDEFLEMRLVECLGRAGQARATLDLPHAKTFLTDLTGGRPQPLPGGPEYTFPVRPQEIVTLRFQTSQPAEAIQPLLKWDELVPPAKLPLLRKKLHGALGHPPLGKEK
ncbi:MAG: hypothetical protein JXB10_12440 [Pirellulales bacterium]|nr:hypothetical protein [Pirellulales bacterium]